MAASSDQLECFLRAVHRRLVVVRAVERAGVCLAIAAGFAAVLALAMWWEGRDALAGVGSVLVLGTIIGLAWGLARRPRVMDAAMEADRQLQLADLLGTALASLRDDDPWSRSVVAMAEARVRTLAPGSVILHRYGGRAWGGIGLSAALVLTLGAMSSLSRSTQAQRAGPEVTSPAGQRTAPVPNQEVERRGAAQPTREAESTGDAKPPPRDPETGAGAGAERAEATPSTLAPTRPSGAGETSSGVGSTGGKTDQSNLGAAPTARTGEPLRDGVNNGEDASAGGGVETGPPTGSSGASGLTSQGPVNARSARPWESSSWSGDRARAEEAVRSGRIPDAYRDVVRRYFRSDATD